MVSDQRIANYIGFLRESQYWPEDRIRSYQERALAQVVSYAYSQIPFYSTRLKPLFRKPFGPHLEHWNQVPVLRRDDVREFRRALTGVNVPAEFGRAYESTTSGSTGTPVRVSVSALASVANRCFRVRAFDWFGFDPTKVYAHLVSQAIAYPDGQAVDFWDRAYRALDIRGTKCLLDISTPIEQQVEWLVRMRPAYIQCFVNNMVEIAKWVQEREIRLRPEGVVTGGECLSDEQRQRIATSLGTKVCEHYATVEVGTIAAQCSECTKLHCADELMRVEFIDDDDCAVEAGSQGRVVVTPFNNFAMPLIRYEIGDRAVVGRSDSCSRNGMTTIERVLGRSRMMFRFPDGSTVWPNLRSYNLYKIFPFHQYRLIQQSDGTLEFEFVSERDPTDDEAARTTQYIRTVFTQPDIGVTLSRVGRLDRDPSGKYHDYISYVASEESQTLTAREIR